MVKKEIKLGGGSVTFIKPKEMTIGQIVKGYYLGSPLSREYEKPNHNLRSSLEASDKPAVFGRGDVVINSAGQLDKLIEEGLNSGLLNLGDYLEIEYRGMEVIKKGKRAGKEAHQFNVSVIDDVTPIVVQEAAEEDQPEAPAPRKSMAKVK